MEALRENGLLIEALTPALDDPDIEGRLRAFGERYRRILDHGAAVSIPDNPMGRLRFTALEVMEVLALPVDPERLLLHVNTFHRREELDAFLAAASGRGLRYLLVVSGDGAPRLPRLDPAELGLATATVTAVELLGYIRARFPGAFVCGVAFNQYEPQAEECAKLERKLDAGAELIITQPVVGADPRITAVVARRTPLFVEAWMSPRVEGIYECAGVARPHEEPGAPAYSPEDNLQFLRSAYPASGLYLSMLSGKRDWNRLLRRSSPAAKAD